MKNEIELEKLLIEWFEENGNLNNFNKQHFWTRNKVGLIIKERLNALGKWKYRRRGNPEKGWQKLKDKKQIELNKKSMDW